MAVYQIDSSGLVKRYVEETGSSLIKEICEPVEANTISIVRVSLVEVIAAFSRRRREGTLDEQEFDDLCASFLEDCDKQYQICEVSPALVSQAIYLVKKHLLRGFDAIQLAAALLIKKIITDGTLLPLTFISADDRLNDAARGEGIPVIIPNHDKII